MQLDAADSFPTLNKHLSGNHLKHSFDKKAFLDEERGDTQAEE